MVGGQGLSAASLEVAAAAGVRREYTGGQGLALACCLHWLGA